jgi:SAM-dependent methyltransferase
MPNNATDSSNSGQALGRVGFESGSDVYERSRPTYPVPAVEHFARVTGIGKGTLVLDLASGTGKFTRSLKSLGAACVGVEPSASMREVFASVLPDVPVLAGTAERIPLTSDSMDVAVVAQAFHWFDPAVALPEIARVLRPHGWLGLIWNERDETDPAMAELVRISKWDTCQPYPVGMDFGVALRESGLFGPVERTRFPFVQYLDLNSYVEQVASRSYVQVLPDEEQRTLLGRVADFGSTLGEPIAMPYITDLFCAQLLA